MEFLPQAFQAMDSYSQFILYKLVPRGTTGKKDKLPVSYITGNTHDAHDPTIWMSASDAISMAKSFGPGYGVGFVFTRDDPFFFLDIDGCLQSDNTWSPIAIELCTLFNGAAVEVSSSGRGLHIFGCGEVMPHECRNSQYHLELYTEKRFVALTGLGAVGDARTNCTPGLLRLVNDYFKPKTSKSNSKKKEYIWTTESCNGDQGLTDDELISLARRSASPATMFGDGVSFEDLWTSNENKLSIAYPPDEDSKDTYNRSTADMSLAMRLAFWTGNNCERIQRLMERSELVREKWNREKYLTDTIGEATVRQKTHFINSRKSMPQENTTQSAGIQVVGGRNIIHPEEQKKHFEGCAYVLDQKKIFVPGGYLLDREQFRAIKGGYSFVLGAADNSIITRNAWEAFTESQCLIVDKVDGICFKPQEATGAIIELDDRKLINIHRQLRIKRTKGDPSPLLWHIQKTMATEQDEEILKAYVAALVQHQGTKFKWCPILQGVEGNGKSLFFRIIMAALGREYCHMPRASELGSKFNDFLDKTKFIGINDIYGGPNQTEILETMKVMVTEEYQAIEPKGGKKYMAEICANFMITTNYKDGIRKTSNDRRYAPFFMKQQRIEDLIRDDMPMSYFSNFFSWLEDKDGFAISTDWMETYDIPKEFNPAGICKRAPLTSSTNEAIRVGKSPIEQEVLEAIDSGHPGMRGGWVSTYWLDRFLKEKNLGNRLPLNRRKEFLELLDYIPHPGLTDGRTATPIAPEGVRSRLYIKKDHPHIHIENPQDVANAYTKAQEGDK